MFRRTTQPLAVWFLTCDLALTALAWVGAYLLRFSGWFPVSKTPPEFALCLRATPEQRVDARRRRRAGAFQRIRSLVDDTLKRREGLDEGDVLRLILWICVSNASGRP